jgi:hypothetical protein
MFVLPTAIIATAIYLAYRQGGGDS